MVARLITDAPTLRQNQNLHLLLRNAGGRASVGNPGMGIVWPIDIH